MVTKSNIKYTDIYKHTIMQENMRTKFDYSKLTRSHDQNMKLKQQ